MTEMEKVKIQACKYAAVIAEDSVFFCHEDANSELILTDISLYMRRLKYVFWIDHRKCNIGIYLSALLTSEVACS